MVLNPSCSIPGVGQPEVSHISPKAHSHVPGHSHEGKNPHFGHQTANNTLHAPFASKVMSFLSTLRVGPSSS